LRDLNDKEKESYNKSLNNLFKPVKNECSVCGGWFEYNEAKVELKGNKYCLSCYEDEITR